MAFFHAFIVLWQGEAGDELQERRVRARRHVHRGRRAQHGPEAVLEDGRLGEGRRDAGGQPAGVAPGGPRGDTVAVEHRDP